MPSNITAADMDALVRWLAGTYRAGMGGATTAARAAALKYARRRAGELVGMSYDAATGAWEPSSNVALRIGKDIRAAIRKETARGIAAGDSPGTIRAALDDILGQVGPRSLMIAHTEAATTLNVGTLAGGALDGVELWDVLDGEGCLPDGHDDGADLPDPDVIGVQEDRQANGQRWTTEQAAQYVIGHPNCVRDFVPVVPDGAPAGEGT